MCKFCNKDILSKNFTRHLERHRGSESEVKSIFQFPTKSKERRELLSLLRHSANFELYLKGTVRPSRTVHDVSNYEETDYSPCAYCKKIVLTGYLKRHAKLCLQKAAHTDETSRRIHTSKSHTLTACATDQTHTISKLHIKQQVG